MTVQPVNTRTATIGAAGIPGFNNIHIVSLYHDDNPELLRSAPWFPFD